MNKTFIFIIMFSSLFLSCNKETRYYDSMEAFGQYKNNFARLVDIRNSIPNNEIMEGATHIPEQVILAKGKKWRLFQDNILKSKTLIITSRSLDHSKIAAKKLQKAGIDCGVTDSIETWKKLDLPVIKSSNDKAL